jgi:negative regulator of replication initiation
MHAHHWPAALPKKQGEGWAAMPVATTRLPQEISDYLATRSKITGESVSDLLRQAAEEWIANQDLDELVRVQQDLNKQRDEAMEHLLALEKKRKTKDAAKSRPDERAPADV